MIGILGLQMLTLQPAELLYRRLPKGLRVTRPLAYNGLGWDLTYSLLDIRLQRY